MSICRICKHRTEGITCKAYPKGIPHEILSSQVGHDKERKEQIGILFLKKRN